MILSYAMQTDTECHISLVMAEWCCYMTHTPMWAEQLIKENSIQTLVECNHHIQSFKIATLD